MDEKGRCSGLRGTTTGGRELQGGWVRTRLRRLSNKENPSLQASVGSKQTPG
jgi:hypothetical protein